MGNAKEIVVCWDDDPCGIRGVEEKIDANGISPACVIVNVTNFQYVITINRNISATQLAKDIRKALAGQPVANTKQIIKQVINA